MTAIGVSLINYQAAAETIRCVESLLAETRESAGSYSLSIRVADNQSDEADYQRLHAGLAGVGGVSLVRHEANLGFAGGHNRNIEHLLADKEVNFIWLLNNDCEIVPGTVEALLGCAIKRPKVGIWGATLLESAEGPVQCAGGCTYRAWLSSYTAIGHGKSPEQLRDLNVPRFDYIAGASLFMPVKTLLEGLEPAPGRRPEAVEKWLNEEFFLYFEELDLARRLRPGLEMGWCRDAIVVHAGGSGTGSRAGGRSRQGEFHSTLSALKYTDLYLPGMLWLMAPARLLAKSFINLVTLRFDLMLALFSAYGAFFAWRRGGPRR